MLRPCEAKGFATVNHGVAYIFAHCFGNLTMHRLGRTSFLSYFFLASQELSVLLSLVAQYAILWQLTLHLKSGLVMTGIIALGFLPIFLLGPFASLWAEGQHKKALLQLSNGSVLLGSLGLLLFQEQGGLAMVLLSSFLRALGQGIRIPTLSASIPALLPESRLEDYRRAFTARQSAAMLVAPMLAGALLGISGLPILLAMELALVLTSGTALLALQVDDPAKASGRKERPSLAQLKSALSQVLTTPSLRSFFAFVLLFLLLISPMVLLAPLQLARNFGDEVWRLTLMEVLYSICLGITSLVLGLSIPAGRNARSMSLGAILVGLFTILLSLAPSFTIYLVLMAFIGLSIPLYDQSANRILAHASRGPHAERLVSLMALLGSSLIPMGMLFFGPLSDLLPVEAMMLGSGTGSLLLGLLSLRSRSLQQMGWEEGGQDSLEV